MMGLVYFPLERQWRHQGAPRCTQCRIRILLRVFRGISDDRILANSAAATFYALLALFPAIAALVSIYGLFMSSAIRLSIFWQLDHTLSCRAD
jgi:uncharacterized BrkB/YihY/UPF0761 family membrane protein